MELKPCPFCGSEAKLLRSAGSHMNKDASYWVGCKTPACPMYQGTGKSWDQGTAFEVWNRRAPQGNPGTGGGGREEGAAEAAGAGAPGARDQLIQGLYELQFPPMEPGELEESKQDAKWYAYWSAQADRIQPIAVKAFFDSLDLVGARPSDEEFSRMSAAVHHWERYTALDGEAPGSSEAISHYHKFEQAWAELKALVKR